MRVLDLFSGIGGFSLGLESTGGFGMVAFCEIEPFCRKVLAHHWPGVPIHDDIRTLSGEPFRGAVDLVCGGFPCQDISVAGKGAGLGGARSGLWYEMLRVVREVRPHWLLIENVPALRTRGADDVLGGLEAEGYSCWPFVVGAWAVGAPHRRDRVWIVAHRDSEGLGVLGSGGLLDGQREASRHDADGRGEREMGDSNGAALREQPGRRSGQSRQDPAEPGGASPYGLGWLSTRPRGQRTLEARSRWPARPGEPQHEWEEPRLAQFQVGCDSDGLPERLARRANREALKALGNSIVPQVAAAIGRAILEVERGSR